MKTFVTIFFSLIGLVMLLAVLGSLGNDSKPAHASAKYTSGPLHDKATLGLFQLSEGDPDWARENLRGINALPNSGKTGAICYYLRSGKWVWFDGYTLTDGGPANFVCKDSVPLSNVQ